MPAGVSRQWLGGKHHGHIHLASQLRQPFGVARIGETREMKGVLVGGSGDDRIDSPAEGESGCSLNGVTGYAAGPDDSLSVGVGLATPQPPAADRNAVLRRDCADLVFRTHQRNLCWDRIGQRARGDLGADPARVTEGDSEPRI
jgi:hypothetical protein